LELFAGIGGFSAAFKNQTIVCAVDINEQAARVYRSNFKHTFLIAEIASLSAEWFYEQSADLWWMSPPCTPFTRRGRSAGLEDPRSSALRHLIGIVPQVLPNLICIENVVGFERSKAFHRICREWGKVGYHIDWTLACPTHLCWPNLRPRFYAIASLEKNRILSRRYENLSRVRLSDFLVASAEEIESLRLENRLANQYEKAIDRVQATNIDAVTACFTSAYGKSVIRSGSYLETGAGYRRFSPREVCRLLGFEDDFVLPSELSRRQLWHLLGNSLSIPVIRALFGEAIS
jgi:site-specific DNA-cytosine methylase